MVGAAGWDLGDWSGFGVGELRLKECSGFGFGLSKPAVWSMKGGE